MTLLRSTLGASTSSRCPPCFSWICTRSGKRPKKCNNFSSPRRFRTSGRRDGRWLALSWPPCRRTSSAISSANVSSTLFWCIGAEVKKTSLVPKHLLSAAVFFWFSLLGAENDESIHIGPAFLLGQAVGSTQTRFQEAKAYKRKTQSIKPPKSCFLLYFFWRIKKAPYSIWWFNMFQWKMIQSL